jgi:hypothetical protein
MKNLGINWLTEYTTDFEYKKYLLLSYLNSVDQEYKESKLFPSFSDVLFHYRNLVSLKEKQEFFKDHLPKKMSGVDFENLQLIYEKLKETDNSLLEVEQLIDFSIPKFQFYWEQGKTIFDLVEHDLSINPVGIIPIDTTLGYLIFDIEKSKEKKVYEYSISLIEDPNENYRLMKTQFIKSYYNRISDTFFSIKNEMLKLKNSIANPGVYSIQSKISYPFEETILPITKRIFLSKSKLDRL